MVNIINIMYYIVIVEVFYFIFLSTYRYMTFIGVSISSERQMRRRRDELVHDCIEGKMMPLIFRSDNANGSCGFIVKDTPFVFIKDVPELIIEFLERHHEYE